MRSLYTAFPHKSSILSEFLKKNCVDFDKIEVLICQICKNIIAIFDIITKNAALESTVVPSYDGFNLFPSHR